MNPFSWKTFEWLEIPFEEYESETSDSGFREYLIGPYRYPSMTSILSILDDGGIDKWKKRVGEEEANRILKEAIDRGNSLHDLSEAYLKNKLERKDIKGPGSVLFNRNRRVLDTLGPIVATEVCLYSKKYKFAGRTDCIAFQGKDLCIVDHKNSRREIDLSKGYARKKIFSYQMQTVGYALAFGEMFPELITPSHGILIFGIHETSRNQTFKFEIKPLIKSFEHIVSSYYNKANIKDSIYFRL